MKDASRKGRDSSYCCKVRNSRTASTIPARRDDIRNLRTPAIAGMPTKIPARRDAIRN
jgi:hypothetical protein